MPFFETLKIKKVILAQHTFIAVRVDRSHEWSYVPQTLDKEIEEKLLNAQLSISPVLQLVLMNAYIGPFKF